ncbi:geranylgeranylglycerol-phosphate geranylgeranyltransferase [Lutimonas zeaxanthinifaciens]|uniref:geranylgeranylglycerol-phosphate geranylgeranyltransferase n=1 Tax=Lutimonas zeaxanthinifaciens TaxID=3060215 RepID=UPI00265C999E|nr:geranylgeranylglycerol-phosphate geranylgeranyltransferase [Lutimonas sp. YSD2104]WKK64684.1 geranylgeranylglycerol-phosphate geranylgeranyltransferase [Lutimonas sp. YSD2104]
MILLIQYLFKYFLFEKYNIEVSLDDLHFGLLAFSTVFVAIAGYIINDVNDVKTDIINKPDKLFVDKKITRINAHYLFIGFNSVGLLIGMYLSYYIGHTSYFIIYVLTSLLLYQYAKYLKKMFILGNITVSLIIFLCILMTAVFDVAPATNGYNLEAQIEIFYIFLTYGVFGFLLTFIREIVKDMEDIEGDKSIDAKSFPIVMGNKKTKVIIFVIALVLVSGLSFLIFRLYESEKILVYYTLIMVLLPLIFFINKLYWAREKSDFHFLSSVLKMIMLTGMLSILTL